MVIKYRLQRLVVIGVLIIVSLLCAPKPASAAWRYVQAHIASTYPMQRVSVYGQNQYGQWRFWTSWVNGATEAATYGWWWHTYSPLYVRVEYQNGFSQEQQFDWWWTPTWYDWQTASFTYYGTNWDNPSAPGLSPGNGSTVNRTFSFQVNPAPANYTGQRDWNVGVEQIGGTWRWGSGWTRNTNWTISVPADGQYRLWAQQGDTVNRGSPVTVSTIVVKSEVGMPRVISPSRDQVVRRDFRVEIGPGTLNYTGQADWLVEVTWSPVPETQVIQRIPWTRSQTANISLVEDGWVYIRIRQGDTVNVSSPWSEPVRVLVSGVPRSPTIIDPKDGFELTQPTFEVRLGSTLTVFRDGLDYRVEVSSSPDFTADVWSSDWQRLPGDGAVSMQARVSRYWRDNYVRAYVRTEVGDVSTPSPSVRVSAPFRYGREEAASLGVYSQPRGEGQCTTYVGRAMAAGGVPGADGTWVGNHQLIAWMKQYPEMWEFRSIDALESGDIVFYSSAGGDSSNWQLCEFCFGHTAVVTGRDASGTLASHWNVGGEAWNRPVGWYVTAPATMGVHIKSDEDPIAPMAQPQSGTSPALAPTFIPPGQ